MPKLREIEPTAFSSEDLKRTGLSEAERWISERRSMWERRFERLGNLLAEPDEVGPSRRPPRNSAYRWP
jgi:hypothetical protein